MAYTISPNQQDSHQSVSKCLMAVWPFTNRISSGLKQDKKKNLSLGVSVNRPVVIASDILSVTVSSTKGELMDTAEVLLSSGDINYVSAIAPGEHAMIWMFNNASDLDRVGNIVLDNASDEGANDFDSGLKFVGRVNSVRETLVTSGDGKKQLRYRVILKSFYELSTFAYFNPLLATTNNNSSSATALIFGELSKEWLNAFLNSVGSNNVSVVISALVNIFLGSGPGKQYQKITNQVRSGNSAMGIPSDVVKKLGLGSIKQENTTINRYSDILQLLIGIQKYTPGANPTDALQLLPSNVDENASKRTNQIYTDKPLSGMVINPPNNYNNVTIWSLLQANANLTLNEMYTCLKVTYNGSILPTLTVRQIPFTSQKRDVGTNRYTAFMELPRWKISDDYPIMSYNLGTTDVARFNYFECFSTAALLNYEDSVKQQMVDNRNLDIDYIDIARSGLRTHRSVSMADASDGSERSPLDVSKWTKLIADFYIDGHYKENGSITVSGIQEPISVGDNLEFNGKVFHIEAINHSYSVDVSGKKQFITTLSLSHGVKVDNTYVIQDTKKRSLIDPTHVPGYTDEEVYLNNKPIVSSGTESNDQSEDASNNEVKTLTQQAKDRITKNMKGG